MSTAIEPRTRINETARGSGTVQPADRLVIFGITGDLAKVMTFHSLYRLELRGLLARFTRQDSIEETWRIMQPLLDSPPPVHTYAPGTWGPPAAEELLGRHSTWHGPWLPS